MSQPPKLQEIRDFIRSPFLKFDKNWITAFFSPEFSQAAVDHWRLHGHFAIDEAQALWRQAQMGSLEYHPYDHFAFWEFCRDRAPTGCHPAHIAAVASTTWQFCQVKVQMIDLINRIPRRSKYSWSPADMIDSMRPYRISPIVMCQTDIDAFAVLPDEVRVYRGGEGPAEVLKTGCFWSTNRNVAELYAGQVEGGGIVVEHVVSKSEIVAMHFFPQSAEVVFCPPNAVRSAKVQTEPSPEERHAAALRLGKMLGLL